MTDRPTRAGRDDDGFTLVELLVAMMIITGVLLVLMAVQTSALVTTAQARQRTQATAISNEIMEEMRALPWLVLSKGLNANFVAGAGGDANVSSGNLRPTVDATINEPLVTDSAQATNVPPLSGTGGSNVTTQSDPSIPGRNFTSRVYVTRSSVTSADVLTLTVITSWQRTGKTTTGSVVARTEAYAPAGGCGDVANQPFLGACQAIFSSAGGASGPSVTITGASVGAPAVPSASPLPVLPGAVVLNATMSLAQVGSSTTSQQATATESVVTHAGTLLQDDDASVPVGTSGFAKVSNAASNDVGSSGAAPANPADVVGVGSSSALSITSGSFGLGFAPGTGTSGVAKASTTASCATGIPTNQPCSAATATGGTASSLTLTAGTGSFAVASIAGGGTAKTFGARFMTTVGGTTVGCTVLTGSGCAAGGAERTLGTATFGSGPWAGGAASSGVAYVTGYADSARTERGTSQPVAAGVATRTGHVYYWNGSSYTDLAVGLLTSSTVTGQPVTWTSGGVTVTAQATITVTPSMSIASNPDPLCKSDGCVIDADAGTVTVAVTYTLTDGAGQSAFIAATNLGTSRANASYKAAPSA